MKTIGIIIGILLATLGMKGVLLPLNVSIGGFAGISQLLNYFWGMPFSVSAFLLNGVFFAWALKRHGSKAVCTAIVTTAVFNLILDYLPEFVLPPMTSSEQLIAICVAAIATGLGFGCILRAGSTVGGSDFMTEMITLRYPAISRGAVGTLLNLLIVCSTAVFFGGANFFRAVIATILVNESLNITLYGFSENPIPGSLQQAVRVAEVVRDAIARVFNRPRRKHENGFPVTFEENQLVTIQFGHQHVTLKVINVTND